MADVMLAATSPRASPHASAVPEPQVLQATCATVPGRARLFGTSRSRQRPQFSQRASQTARRAHLRRTEGCRCKVIDMLKQRWTAVYPDPRDALPVLLGAAEAGRLHDRGEVTVTADEAGALQQAGYTAILGAGCWPAPSVPLDLLRPHPSLAPLALLWYGPRALDPPPQPIATLRVQVEMTPAKRLRWRLGDALRDPDQRRLLTSLVGRPDGPVECRRFQNALHRLETPRFNAAIGSLIAADLVQRVTHDGVGCFLLSADMRHLIRGARVGVRRAPSARAMRRTDSGASSQRATRRARRKCARSSTNKRPYRPRPIPDRRLNPRAWGKSMRARLGGLTVQRLYRKFGVHPTAPATAGRRAKRAEQERRQLGASTSVAYTAPEAPAAATPSPGDDWFSAAAAERVAAALDYGQPVGRRERLGAERERR